MDTPHAFSNDVGTIGRIRVAAVVAGLALATFMGSRLTEWWSIHHWFEQTISNPGEAGQPWDPNWNLIEHLTGVLWMLTAVTWGVFALTGFDTLRRRVSGARLLLSAGGTLLVVLPGAISIGLAGPSPMRPDQLFTADFIWRTVAALGGLAVTAFAARRPRMTQQS